MKYFEKQILMGLDGCLESVTMKKSLVNGLMYENFSIFLLFSLSQKSNGCGCHYN